MADPSAVRDLAERWHSELAPAARGWLGSTGVVSEDGELFVLVRFESAAAAAANSDRPEQDRWWAAMAGLLVGEVTFQDSSDVQVDVVGDLDTAGFVQVLTGRTSDPERSRELMNQARPPMAALRPDVLGGVIVGHDDGNWTRINYFTSEADARAAERTPPPSELMALMAEAAALAVGPPPFLDLREPFLQSPG